MFASYKEVEEISLQWGVYFRSFTKYYQTDEMKELWHRPAWRETGGRAEMDSLFYSGTAFVKISLSFHLLRIRTVFCGTRFLVSCAIVSCGIIVLQDRIFFHHSPTSIAFLSLTSDSFKGLFRIYLMSCLPSELVLIEKNYDMFFASTHEMWTQCCSLFLFS
jgi:hypothetical protein